MVDRAQDLAPLFWLIGLAVLAGFALGSLYFALLWRSVRALPAASDPWRSLAGGAVMRVALIGSALVALLAAGIGASAIVPGAAGFLLARLVATGLARGPRTGAPEEG